MSSPHLLFRLPEDRDTADVLDALGARLGCRFDAPERVKRAFLDTFDWRLYRAGAALECVEARSGAGLRWRGLDSGVVLFDRPVPAVPRFAWDLPQGALRRRLQRCAGVRAFVPVASERLRRTRGRVVDSEGKTVLRLELWEPARGRGPRHVQLLPVKGYDKPLQRAMRRLQRELGALPPGVDPILEGTREAPRQPDDFARRQGTRLQPAMRADEACKLVLTELVTTIRENERGVLDDVDSEFLHDYRVAMRRTRSLLTQVKDVFPPSRLRRFLAGFGWLSSLTGPPRDMDVYLLGFGDYRAAVPARLRDGLEPFHEDLRRSREAAYQTLWRAMGSPRYRELLGAWERFVTTDVPRRPTMANAARPVLTVARERIWRVYRRALTQGRAIEESTPAESLHELRKTCKKLRYLVEFFRSLFPAREVAASLRVLKSLQDVLGDFQDFEVQRAHVTAVSGSLEAEGRLDAPAREAMGLLVEHLAARQDAARGEFQARFSGFDSKLHRAEYRALYRPRGNPAVDRPDAP